MRRAIEANLSNEFAYAKTGFVLVHHGTKGVTVHAFYWSDWRGTAECHAWAEYQYGHAYTDFEPLDQAEPIFCGWDLPLIQFETVAWLSCVETAGDPQKARNSYLRLRWPAIGESSA